MMNHPSISKHPLYYYISTRANFDPCRTIYLCAPEEVAADLDALKAFASSSGWQDIAEAESAVLVAPAAPNGWEAEPDTLLMDIFNETRNRFTTCNGEAIWGRMGSLWCWETLLYAVGYEEGAGFVGRTLVATPNVLAAGAMVNGCPVDFSAGDDLSTHWLVPKVSDDYKTKNREIPVCAWFYTGDQKSVQPAVDYFQANGSTVCVNCGTYAPDRKLSYRIMADCFSHIIRWKNGPDGTLAKMDSRSEFYQNPRFLRRSVKVMGTTYGYSVHLPEGMSKEDVQGLPLVFTIHGRGEPAWMFTTKNGWDTLADRTKEFVLISPDSPGNIWFLTRDGEAFPKMVEAMASEFGVDPSRVYLTGFSNGSMLTRELALRYPQLFAAISPWNGPRADTFFLQTEDSGTMPDSFSAEMQKLVQEFEEGGWEMPAAFFFGDRDGASKPNENYIMETILRSNKCSAEQEAGHPTGWHPDAVWTEQNHYTHETGFTQGSRFTTYLYHDSQGTARVTATIMKNMPHGAIYDQSTAAWEFLRQFRRPQGGRTVIVMEE